VTAAPAAGQLPAQPGGPKSLLAWVRRLFSFGPTPESSPLIDCFPSHLRQATAGAGLGATRAVFAEVHWADLSRVREGVWQLLAGLFYVIFGMIHIGDQALNGRKHGRILRALLFGAAALLCGPIAALDAFLAIFLVARAVVFNVAPAAVFNVAFRQHGYISPAGVTAMLLILAVVALVFAWLGLRRRWWPSVLFWGSLVGVAVCSLLLAGVLFWDPEWSFSPEAVLYIRYKYFPDIPLYRPRAIVSALGQAGGQSNPWQAGWAARDIVQTHPNPGRADWYIALALLAVHWLFWLVAMLLVAALVSHGISWLRAGRRGEGEADERPALNIAYAAVAVQVVLWVLVIPTLIRLEMQLVEKVVPVRDPPAFGVQWQLLAFNLFAGLFLGLAGTLTLRRLGGTAQFLLLAVSVCCFLALFPTFPVWLVLGVVVCVLVLIASTWWIAEPGEVRPRLLIGKWVALMLAWILIATTIVLTHFLWFRSPVWPAWFKDEAPQIVGGLVTVLVLLFPMFARKLRNVLHVLLDVGNHFDRPEQDFPTRRRIETRFRIVLNTLLERERPTHLVVLAHSQGSVIAADGLNSRDPTTTRNLASLTEVTLVTMGSPFTHLYQYYFGRAYPPLGDCAWEPLRRRVKRWINVYRVDDYIGTYVDESSLGSQSPSGDGVLALSNHNAGYGGHTNYWRQQEVLCILVHWLPGGWSAR